MTGIRIDGSKKEIAEALRRLHSVFHVNDKDNYFEKKDKWGNIIEGEFYCYIRAYTYDKDCTFDLMESYKKDVDELTEKLAAAQSTIERLRQKLGEIPQAKRGDMVLSPRHRNEK